MTKQTISFDYFHGYESEQFAFYRIPKVLFTNDYFKGLSSDAKVLYGLMLDRMALSVKNHWIDDKDRVYIIFTLEQVMEYMNCGKDKGVKILAELDTEKGIGLIERVKRGLGKPAIIYVKSFLIKESAVCHEAEKDVLSLDSENRNLESESQSAGLQNRSPEVGKSEIKTSEKTKSGVLENRSADFGKSDTIKTDYNNTDLSETYPINQSGGEAERKRRRTADGTGGMDQMDMIRAYTEIIKENIDYDSLIESCSIGDRGYVAEILDLLTETVSIERDTVCIAGAEYPFQMVKGKMMKLNYGHIQYVLECLHKNTTKVRNIRAYLLACLFNAPSTINSYYRAEVNHDMYGGIP